jgi:hypothetical protein
MSLSSLGIQDMERVSMAVQTHWLLSSHTNEDKHGMA